MHIHVGSNMPGYLPESEPGCFDDPKSAIEFLRHELRDQQNYYYENCDTVAGLYGQSDPEACECDWCGVAGDVEAALSDIADGDVLHDVRRGYAITFLFSPPQGADIVHWLVPVEGDVESCEIDE